MDQESINTEAELVVTRKQKNSNNLLPVSILIAAVLIAGALIYNRSGSLLNLKSPEKSNEPITNDTIKKWAKQIGINMSEFNQCFDSAKYTQEIDKDITDGSTAGVSGTPTTFVNGVRIVGAQPYANFQAIIEQALKKQILPKDVVKVSVDDDPVLGKADAPVTLIEFSDFQCPFCRAFWKEALQQIKKDYIDTGKAKFVYRDFPLSFHPLAKPYALAANCANDQGKFWEMHDKIFEEQAKKGEGTIQ